MQAFILHDKEYETFLPWELEKVASIYRYLQAHYLFVEETKKHKIQSLWTEEVVDLQRVKILLGNS